jgi:hypothetical protein
MSKPRLLWATVLIGGFFLVFTLLPALAGAPTEIVVIWFGVVGAIDLLIAWKLYWVASLSYIVSEDGLTIRDCRGDKHLKWDEIVGVRLVPFTKYEDYNLELKNGKTQKIVSNIDEGFIDCLKYYLPQTKYWWWPE